MAVLPHGVARKAPLCIMDAIVEHSLMHREARKDVLLRGIKV